METAVFRIFFLAGVEDEDVHWGAVDIEGSVDGGGQLAHGGGEQVVGGVENGELGEQGGAPSVLVGTRAVVNVHAKVFGQELGGVAVTHDDALQIRFQKANDIDFQFLDEVAHAVLGRPHIVVQREVNGPDASGE